MAELARDDGGCFRAVASAVAQKGLQRIVTGDRNAGIIDDQVEHRKLRRQIHPCSGRPPKEWQIRDGGRTLLPSDISIADTAPQAVVQSSVDGWCGARERDAQTYQPDRQQGREQPFQQPRQDSLRAGSGGARRPLIGLSVPLPTGLSMQ